MMTVSKLGGGGGGGASGLYKTSPGCLSELRLGDKDFLQILIIMFSFNMLFSVVALTLLAVTEESSSGGERDFHYELSGQDLTDLYNSPVDKAEWMIRPFGSSSSAAGPLSHTGVRVTLDNGAQWLIHKGNNYGIDSQTVVTNARHMSSAWRTIITRRFNGRKTVADFVKTGGETYNILFNCHVASIRMMLQ